MTRYKVHFTLLRSSSLFGQVIIILIIIIIFYKKTTSFTTTKYFKRNYKLIRGKQLAIKAEWKVLKAKSDIFSETLGTRSNWDRPRRVSSSFWIGILKFQCCAEIVRICTSNGLLGQILTISAQHWNFR